MEFIGVNLGMFALAVVLDLAFGEPPAALHPVVWMGKVLGLLVRIAPKRGQLVPFVSARP